MKEIRDGDPTLALLRIIMGAWREAFGGQNVTARTSLRRQSSRATLGLTGVSNSSTRTCARPS